MVDQPFGDDIVEVVLPLPPLIRGGSPDSLPAGCVGFESGIHGPIQEALRRDYPILRQEREVSLVVGADGAVSQPTNGVIWRFTIRTKYGDCPWGRVFFPSRRRATQIMQSSLNDLFWRLRRWLL